MRGQTRGMDYFKTISTFFEKNQIYWQKLISIYLTSVLKWLERFLIVSCYYY